MSEFQVKNPTLYQLLTCKIRYRLKTVDAGLNVIYGDWQALPICPWEIAHRENERSFFQGESRKSITGAGASSGVKFGECELHCDWDIV